MRSLFGACEKVNAWQHEKGQGMCSAAVAPASRQTVPVSCTWTTLLISSYGLLFQEDKGRQEHRPSFHLLSVCFLVISPVAVAKCLRRSNLQEGGAYLGSRFEVIQSPMVAGSGKAAPHIAPRAQKQREMNRSRLEW